MLFNLYLRGGKIQINIFLKCINSKWTEQTKLELNTAILHSAQRCTEDVLIVYGVCNSNCWQLQLNIKKCTNYKVTKKEDLSQTYIHCACARATEKQSSPIDLNFSKILKQKCPSTIQKTQVRTLHAYVCVCVRARNGLGIDYPTDANSAGFRS